jgi:hypothetical protein
MVILVDPLYTCASVRNNVDLYICIYSINERLRGGSTAKTVSASADAPVALSGTTVAGGVNRMIAEKKHIFICS